MRITSNMTAQAQTDSGIPILQNTLVDTLADKSGNIFSALNKTYENSESTQKKTYTDMDRASQELSATLTKLADTTSTSVFNTAVENDSIEDVTKQIKNIVDSFNDLLDDLKTAGGTLNTFYAQQLKDLVKSNSEALATVGITQNKDGSLSVSEKTLDASSLTNLQTLFGSTSDFAQKLAYISGKINSNSQANLDSISTQYTANGQTASYTAASSRFNSLG